MTKTLAPFKASDYLTDDKTIAEFVIAILEDPNLDLHSFLTSLSDIAHAKGKVEMEKDIRLLENSINVDSLNSREYEALVHQLTKDLLTTTNLSLNSPPGLGAENKIPGKSGFPHQIDVSVQTPGLLVLIECKYWKRAVDAAPVLILASRLEDIRQGNPTMDIHASIVSTKAATQGAQQLASHFGISLDVVSNTREYAVRLGQYVFIGMTSNLYAKDFMEMEIVRPNKAQ